MAGDSVVAASDPSGRFGELVGVRVDRGADADSVVFEFAGAVPGYDIRYVSPASVTDVAGNPVSVNGQAALAVEFTSASSRRDVPARVPVGIPETSNGVVDELVRAVDVESRVVWVVGMRERVPFRVAAGPARLVLELSHDD